MIHVKEITIKTDYRTYILTEYSANNKAVYFYTKDIYEKDKNTLNNFYKELKDNHKYYFEAYKKEMDYDKEKLIALLDSKIDKYVEYCDTKRYFEIKENNEKYYNIIKGIKNL